MSSQTIQKKVGKEYDYDEIIISLENSLIPSEIIDETPTMKDGLDRDTENDLRFFGCEMIQIAGLLLKLPQVAMATGQVLLQRFYYSKSMIKHEVEVTAMAAIFLAAKIEESPRRIRDVINVCHHIKQKYMKKSHTPMDYYSNQYMNMKNAVIKAERRILKELGFCVHVKHPHKLIVTYLQMIGFSSNVDLARKAWNYMNDALRSDVFVRFTPEVIACACIFLAARIVKINLPIKPPWWELFDVTYDDIEDITLSILRLYERPRRKISHLETAVSKLKKSLQEKKPNKQVDSPATGGSFTPAHVSTSTTTTTSGNTTNNTLTVVQNNSSKPSSKTNSPVEKSLSSVVSKSSIDNKKEQRNHSSGDRKRQQNDHRNSSNVPSESDSTEYSSDSEDELPSKKYSRQKEMYDRRKRSPSSGSDNNVRRSHLKKGRQSVSPHDDYRKNNFTDRSHNKDSYRGKGARNTDYKSRRRSRSRSPVKRHRSPSPQRSKEKLREKDRQRAKEKYYEKYTKVRR